MITLQQYIDNPVGKGNPLYNAAVRDSIKKAYKERWGFLLLRENGKIKHTFYYDKKRNVYYLHLKIPSETVNTIYYDVVLRLFADEDVTEGSRDLGSYYVQFFSNDPAFVFTYANAFIQHDLFIKDLIPRMAKKAVKKEAKEKNPQALTGYVKTIFFAYLYLRDKGLLNTDAHTEDLPYDKKKLLSEVQDTDTVVEKRQEEGKKKTKKYVRNNRPDNTHLYVGGSPSTEGRASIGKTPKVGRISSVKKTSTVNKIKKK